MKWTACFAVVVLSLVPAGRLQAQDEPTFDLTITVVGEPGPREKALTEFFGRYFREVRFVDRRGGKPPPPADVVVLDWPQGDHTGGFPMPKPPSPLGPRDSWSTPTVLLGSAGHNLAAAWDVRGGSG
jgi:hypothetical protein